MVWPSRFANLAAARAYEKNPEKLANRVYANRNGNGDEASGDGWRYRGRGYIQITGRANYEAIDRETKLGLVDHPDRACEPDTALTVAASWWYLHGCNEAVDRGGIDAVTRIVNGPAMAGIDDRRRWMKIVADTIGDRVAT